MAQTWNQVFRKSKDIVTEFSAYTNSLPISFTLSDDGSKLFYLHAATEGAENTMFRLNLSSADAQPHPLLNASPSNPQAFTKEEQLRRERQRQHATGITQMQYIGSNDSIVYGLDGTLHVVNDVSTCNANASPSTSLPVKTRLDWRVCPGDNDLVSYVMEGEIWLERISTGIAQQLTDVRAGLPTSEAQYVSAGQPSFIIQEEFDRYTGYWWAPDGKHLLYEYVDERAVRKVPIADQAMPTTVDPFVFPRPGDVNADTELRLVSIPDSICRQSDEPATAPARTWRLQEQFPWLEYIPRAGFIPQSNLIFASILDRDQQRYTYVTIDINVLLGNGVGVAQEFFTETADTWVNVFDTVQFVPCTEPDHLLAVVVSEQTGYRHLLLAHKVGNHETERLQITDGPYCVTDGSLSIDKHGNMAFLARKDTPLRQEWYKLAGPANWQALLQGQVELEAVTFGETEAMVELGYQYTGRVFMNQGVEVIVRSNISTPHTVTVRSSSGSNKIYTLPAMVDYTPPELLTLKNVNGTTFYGRVFRSQAASTAPTPTLLYIYGGPHVQVVQDQYSTRMQMVKMMTSLGYHVISFDNRGSNNRGMEFESAALCSMGQYEIEEQVACLQHVMRTRPELNIDPKRIAIHGWSYGGYMSLMALAQRPDVFNVSVAGAPVTLWEAYDTGYTERYMKTPSKNPKGYAAGSVLLRAQDFPDIPNRLLIIHGLIDENVMFTHTATLLDALNEAGKPFDVQVYAQERHSIRKHHNQVHELAKLAWYLVKHNV